MTRRLAIAAVLDGFLGTFISRYSDFDGYWLFGFLIDDVGDSTVPVRIDLLDESEPSGKPDPWTFTRQFAVRRFHEQAAKQQVQRSWFTSAELSMTTSTEQRSVAINGQISPGRTLRLDAHAVTDLGRTYRRTRSLLVAPHDPDIESRSLRAT